MTRRISFTCVALLVLASTCRADGLDVYAWVVRLPPGSSAAVVLASITGILLLDYALNFLVIGWPASRWSDVGTRKVARDLVVLTLLGQLADRAGAILGLILAMPAQEYWVFLAANFACTSVLIGWLVARFARKRWGLSGGRVAWLCVPAAVLTNPMLPLGLLVWLRSR